MSTSLLARAGFVAGMSLLFAWGISFLAPSPQGVPPTVEIPFPELHPTDWVVAIAAGIAIPLTLLVVWALQYLPHPAPRPQTTTAQKQERPIIFNGATPEAVNRLRAKCDEWERKSNEWERKYRELLQARSVAQEPERELSYRAVVALLEAGNVGIAEAIKIVRQNGGMVGRDQSPLKRVLELIPPPLPLPLPPSRMKNRL